MTRLYGPGDKFKEMEAPDPDGLAVLVASGVAIPMY